ncbi:hypothetical protein CQ010_13700 [Arthrobacter sp. MYb211]|uniref:helix-turn-helix transcriptional regulator n=1 Tax=unclassified Arthrobacter TaxID=235627 RepID=UPI000CFCDB9C|nr:MULTISPECIES: LuxR C-terminal-related transcriptional regulator [unclassified Arthrobacter]PRA10521.1 hypothetical protein CQ015_13690 [Arthrobacter sp. MYb221]PRC06092.1 hypothetical protein CQ010_13700 [Arthrobacter sp. MYb211]
MRNRQQLLAKLRKFTHGYRDRAAIISGGPGLGKSWTLEQIGQQLNGQPHRLIRSSKHETSWPLSGLLSFLCAVPLKLSPKVTELFPNAVDAQVDCYQIAMALHQELVEKVEPEMVFLIDDLDLMDAASQRIIGFLASRMQGNRVSFITTISTDRVPEPFEAFRRYSLDRMDPTTLKQVAKDHCIVDLQDSVAEVLAQFAHGNPGTIVEHVKSLTDAQLENHWPLAIPYRPRQESSATMSDLHAQFTPAQINALRYIAIGPLISYASALKLPEVTSFDLRELVTAGIVSLHEDMLSLPDLLMRSRLFWSADCPNRIQLHKHVAEISETPALKLFHESHLDDSMAPSGELIIAAIELLKRGRIHAAIEFVEWALVRLEEENPVPELLAYILQLLRSGQLGIAQRYTQYTLTLEMTSSEKLKLMTLELELMALKGTFIPTSRIYSAVDEHQCEHHALCGNLLSMSALALCLNGQLEDAGADLRRAKELFTKADSDGTPRFLQARMVHDSYTQNFDPILSESQVISRAKPGEVHEITYLTVASALSELGQHEQARATLARLLSGAHGVPLYKSLGLLYDAQLAIKAHDVPRGLKAVERWNSSANAGLMRPLPRIINAWYWLMKNRADKAMPILDSLRPYAHDEIPSIYASRVTELAGLHALMSGRFDEAATHFQHTQLTYRKIVNTQYVETCVNLIEALASANHPEQAANEFRATQSLMASVKSRQAKLLLRRAQAIALPGEVALSRFQSLLETWQPGDSLLELARIHHCYGVRLDFMGRQSQAVKQFIAAKTIYRNIGALGWADSVVKLLSKVDDAPTSEPELELLTHEENQLVSMVRQGLTNKGIADELFISVSAVEARLTRLFRKTGTRNRQQLSAHFALRIA